MEIKGDVGRYLSGCPVRVEEANLVMTQPTVKQILNSGEDEFFYAVHILGRTDRFLRQAREGNPELARYGDFQLLLVVLQEEAKSRRLVDNFFELVLPDYKVSLTDNTMDFYMDDRMRGRITPFSFEPFQRTVTELFISHAKTGDEEEEFNPANDQAAEIAKLLNEAREKRKRMASKGNGDVATMLGTYASVLSIGLGIDINVLLDYTPFQLYDAFTRYFRKNASDMYMRLAMQPFADTSKLEEPEQWYSGIYEVEREA